MRMTLTPYQISATVQDPSDIAILLIAWRRPHTLKQVIDALRPLTPKQLFVACDGANPQRPGEAAKVSATRALIDQSIDWPCQLQRLYSETNLGCRVGVSNAISWFFENVEEGIILEDDCVPHQDFFGYCACLLERYRHDTRVWCISGTNLQKGLWRGDGSYYFSKYNHCWGWASWRRCWQHYDRDLEQWGDLLDSGLLKSIFDDPVERQHWRRIWQRLITEGQPNTWDYQWTFTCLVNGGLTALPNQNLVKNIGFGDSDATHTLFVSKQSPNASINKSLGPITHPSFILRNAEADRMTFDDHHGGKFRRFPMIFAAVPLKCLFKAYRIARKLLQNI